jgi:RHS repeat-associated protein
LAQAWADLGAALQSWMGTDAGLAWLHTNHLGAPEAATNAQGQLVWRAVYAPFGAAQVAAANGSAFVLNLRLPGQVFDAETDLHYNRQRYYDPSQGQYLTPDPLGTPDGPNPYAYVAFNPLTNIDPDGLVLFAFDGTENSDPPIEGSDDTNVVRFRDAYIGRRRYVAGVGTNHQDAPWGVIENAEKDSAVNRTGSRRIDRMMTYLLEEMERETNDTKVIDIDIIGFSRGAAQARDFANNIVSYYSSSPTGEVFDFQTDARGRFTYSARVRNAKGKFVEFTGRQCVNFRFMGLWDTVLTTNVGRDYRLGIPTQFKHVAHAVALNEYRSQPAATGNLPGLAAFFDGTRAHLPDDLHWGGFPLESIGASSSRPGQVRIERGFIGAHADIGGGYAPGDDGLSSVALSWMVAQAKLAKVEMNTRSIRIDMNSPVIHDQSNMLRFGNPNNAPAQFTVPGLVYGTNTYQPEDRQINVNGVATGNTQRNMDFGPPLAANNRSMTNTDTHKYIGYFVRDPQLTGEPISTNSITNIVNLRNRTGVVSMPGYMDWLRKNGYTFVEEN